MSWQLINDGEVIAEHSTDAACKIEAIERGWMIVHSSDYGPYTTYKSLVDGVEIKEVSTDD